MLHGLHPFELHTPSTFARPRQPAAPRTEPIITTKTLADHHTLTITAPSGFALHEPRAVPINGRAVRLEGTLIPDEKRLRDYVTRSRTRAFDEPTPHGFIGFIPAGRVVRGTMPSSRGWIALEDNETFLNVNDGALVAQPLPQPSVFAKRVDLPADAIIERASVERPPAHGKWAVAFGPRVAKRSAPSTSAALVGTLHKNALVEGRRSEADPNWVALGDGSGFVMIDHPRYGTLLETLSDEGDDVGFTISVPRRAPKPSAKRAAEPAPTARFAPRAAPSAPAPPPKVEPQPEMKPQPTSARQRAAEERREQRRAVASSVESLASVEPPVLSEVASNDENVQSPREETEHWVAVDDGGFAPLATA